MSQKIEQKPDVLEAISQSESKRRKLRFDYNLAAIATGSIQAIGSDEFMADLAAFLNGGAGERDLHRQILLALGEALVSPEKVLRERALTLLSVAAQRCVQEQDREKIELLVNSLYKWFEYEQEILPGFETVIKRVEEIVGWLLRMSLWRDAAKIVTLLARINDGRLEKRKAIESLAGRCLANLATRQLVDILADTCLYQKEEQEPCSEILRSLGSPSAAILLDRCIDTPEKTERQALLCLVSKTAGGSLWELIEEALPLKPSAEVLIDIILLVTVENGGEAIFPALMQYFGHEDKRVQQELLRCTIKLGGREMKARLLAALGVVNDSLKIGVIRLLAEHGGGDASVLSSLCDCIEKKCPSSTGLCPGLARAVAIALRAFPHRKSIEALESLQREYANLPDTDDLLQQIDRTLKILYPRLRHLRHCEAAKEISFDSDPLQIQAARNRAAGIDEEVRKIQHQGNSRDAGRLLQQHAQAAGKAGDFVLAEMLMDRIMEIDPMALDEVVELGKWLDVQKKAIVEPLLSEVWDSLRELLSPPEAKALHQVLRRQNYRKGDIIIQAGESDESLYFFTSGDVGLNCLVGGDEHFLKRIKPGNVLGGPQFFSTSVWTSSLRALSEVRAHVLDRDVFGPVAEKFPELEGKLHSYCVKHETKIAELVRSTGDDRREFPRYPAGRLITSSLKDPYGSGGSREFHGELVDISRNGMAFTIKISSRENARLLVGREIFSTIQLGEGTVARCSGMVVGVREQNDVDKKFTVHVKFARRIDELTLRRIASHMKKL